MLHIQLPTPRYRCLGRKWSVMLTRPWSTSAVARSYSRSSHGLYNRTFNSPIRIKSNPVGDAFSPCSMQCKLGLSFGGMYSSTAYHRLDPNVSRKHTTLGPKLYVFSTCHPFSALQNTTTPPTATDELKAGNGEEGLLPLHRGNGLSC